MASNRRQCVSLLACFANRKAATQAAPLMLASNWRKETKKIGVFSEFIRRTSLTTLTSFGAKEMKKKEIMEEESLKHKYLYLCFEEFTTHCDNVHVIHSIPLSHLLSPSANESDNLKLNKVAYRCGPRTIVPRLMSTGVVGSKIIFSGGFVEPGEKDITSSHLPPHTFQSLPSKEVCVFETDSSIDPNPRLQPSQAFNINRPDPVIVEVENKLYCFGSRHECESFEVYEPMKDEWLPLATPPKDPSGFTHEVLGTRILLWRKQQAVYMFDVTHPEKRWTELKGTLGSYIPQFIDDHRLFVTIKSRHGGKGFLLFSINLEEPRKVLATLMSHTCESCIHMEPLQLPAETPPKFDRPCRCRFFHLGGNRVGIVLSCDQIKHYCFFDEDYHFPCHDSDDYDDGDDNNEDEDDNNEDDNEDDDDDDSYNVTSEGPDHSDKVRVLVVIFEYEIIEESMDIKYKLLSSRCLEYSTKSPEGKFDTSSSMLRGAYVL